jgi:RNA polymerase sigma-70 factor (ECF subfamily)
MDPHRVAALLLNAMGYELAEIAALTGTSVAAAQSRLSRGRRELRARLEGLESPPSDHDEPRRP